MATSGLGRNCEFFIAVSEVLLRKVESIQFQHFVANGRSRAVASDDNGGVQGCYLTRLFMTQPERATFQFKSDAALIKVNGYALRFGCIHQRDIQISARDRVDDLCFVLAVGLKGEFPCDR